jgi:hypothetical protein
MRQQFLCTATTNFPAVQNEGNLKEINFEGNVNEILEERWKFEGKSKISPKLVIFNMLV